MGSSWVIYQFLWLPGRQPSDCSPSHGRCGVSSRWAAGAELGRSRLRPARWAPFWDRRFGVNEACGAQCGVRKIQCEYLKSFQKVLVGWSSCGKKIDVFIFPKMWKIKQKNIWIWIFEQVTSQFTFRFSWPVQKKAYTLWWTNIAMENHHF